MSKKVRVSLSEEELEQLISSLDCYCDHLRPFLETLEEDFIKKSYANYGLLSLQLRSRFWELKKKTFGLYPFFESDFSNIGSLK